MFDTVRETVLLYYGVFSGGHMTTVQIEFVRKFHECSQTYWNHRGGRGLRGNALAEIILRNEGLYYEDTEDKAVEKNPVVFALVNSAGPFHCFTLSNYTQLLIAMEYYFRKKAEVDARMNTHDV